MAPIADDRESLSIVHPFLSHLATLLSVYELGPHSAPIPQYDGPSDGQTERILRSLAAIARRMYTAEDALESLRGSETSGPESKKRRNGGSSPRSNDSPFASTTVWGHAGTAQPSADASSSRDVDMRENRPADTGAFAHADQVTCRNCGETVMDRATIAQVAAFIGGQTSAMGASPGPLAAAAFGSWLSAIEELKLLKSQVQDVARVCNAVARGDLSQKITVPVQGVMMEQMKAVINDMVDNLGRFAKEVTRVSQEVGTEGKLGGQALVLDVEGTWRELTGVVNKLAANLTNQVRSIAKVTKAVALGDLSKLIEVDARGEILDLKNTVNGMVLRLRTLASEVTRVTLEVGSRGKLGGQVHVPDVEGVWEELTGNVNHMCSSLTIQVRSISQVTTAIARGDLSQRISVEAKGEMFTLIRTVNSTVDQLGAFTSEVTRVALEVGTQGILGGQARVEGVQGTWADLTRNVNKMASNLTDQVRSISEVTKAVANGDLSRTVNVDVQGEMLDLKTAVNQMVARLSTLANEVTRVSLQVGTEGVMGGQAYVPGVQGMWKVLSDNVNLMAMNLTNQVRSIAEVTKAVAGGDLTKRITVDVRGEMLELKKTVNGMTESLSVFADEVTRVAREVGTEGKLGGQAHVMNVGGTWKDLTDNVNVMAANLTVQVRTIAEATTAVAQGDLTQKVTGVPVSGEMLHLVNTINRMIDQLAIFAAEVKKVAREVGTEGKLGGQAEVGNVQGIWQDITMAVNTMASNLTTQVRGFAQISAAAMDGDFSRLITVEASGEMDSLKTQINQMVFNLRESMQNIAARQVAEPPEQEDP